MRAMSTELRDPAEVVADPGLRPRPGAAGR